MLKDLFATLLRHFDYVKIAQFQRGDQILGVKSLQSLYIYQPLQVQVVHYGPQIVKCLRLLLLNRQLMFKVAGPLKMNSLSTKLFFQLGYSYM